MRFSGTSLQFFPSQMKKLSSKGEEYAEEMNYQSAVSEVTATKRRERTGDSQETTDVNQSNDGVSQCC